MRILRREATKKTQQQQQKTTPATYVFCFDLVDTFVGKCNGAQARRGGRGRGAPTIIITKNNKIQQQSSYPRATPFPPDKGLLSMSASSPTSWGEPIISRASCSPHTQLSRPMSWGHHILESRTTKHKKPDCRSTCCYTPAPWTHTSLPWKNNIHRRMLHRTVAGLNQSFRKPTGIEHRTA